MSRDGYKDTIRNPDTGRRLETRDADYRITGDVDVVGDLTQRGSPAVPVKATGAEADTGTDDAKFLTPKAVNDSHNIPSVPPGADGNVLTSDGTDWVSEAAGGGGVTLETPTGLINGVNDDFVFTSPPIAVYFQGSLQDEGVDYTLAGSTVTFVVPPADGLVKGFV